MESHSNILYQLAELKKWHEQHCTDEETDSSMMAGTLSAEDQAKIYQILGLSPSFISEIETSQSQATDNQLEMNNSSPSPMESDKKLEMIQNNLSGQDQPSTTPAAGQPSVTVSCKRPFLKRGEGLTNRFKVHPDSYNLKNLPKYKFSSAKRRRSATASVDNADNRKL